MHCSYLPKKCIRNYKVCFAANVYGDKLLIGKNIMIFKLKYQQFSYMNSIAFEKCDASGDTAPNQVVCAKLFFRLK